MLFWISVLPRLSNVRGESHSCHEYVTHSYYVYNSEHSIKRRRDSHSNSHSSTGTLESLVDGTILNVVTSVALPRFIAHVASEIVIDKDHLKTIQWPRWKEDYLSPALIEASVGEGCGATHTKESLVEIMRWTAETVVSNIENTLPPRPPAEIEKETAMTHIENADETSRNNAHPHETPLDRALSPYLSDENFCKSQPSVKAFMEVAVNVERFRTMLHAAGNNRGLDDVQVNVVEGTF